MLVTYCLPKRREESGTMLSLYVPPLASATAQDNVHATCISRTAEGTKLVIGATQCAVKGRINTSSPLTIASPSSGSEVSNVPNSAASRSTVPKYCSCVGLLFVRTPICG